MRKSHAHIRLSSASACAEAHSLGFATAGPDHAIEMRGPLDAPRPYVHIRRGLWALIDRKTFYRLADAAMPDTDGRMNVHSEGTVFPLEY